MNAITPEVIALVRESADIVTVVSEHVQLRRSGAQLIGRCRELHAAMDGDLTGSWKKVSRPWEKAKAFAGVVRR